MKGAAQIRRLGDHGFDPAGTQVGADRPGGVRLIAQHRRRAGPGPPYWPGHAQLRQKRKQHRGVPCLAGGDQADQRQPGPIDELMDLRAQPATGAPDAVIGRLLTRILVVRSIPLCGG